MPPQDTINPFSIQRPGVGRDPGVSMRPNPVQDTEVVDPIGRAIRGFSADVERASSVFQKLYEETKDIKDQADVDLFQMEFYREAPKIEQELLNSPEASKPDFVTIYDNRMGELATSVLERLKESGRISPSQKGLAHINHVAARFRSEGASRAGMKAHNQRIAQVSNTVQESLQDIRRSAVESGDINAAIAATNDKLKLLRRITNDETYLPVERAAKEQAVLSGVNGMIERGNFTHARLVLGRHIGYATNSAEETIAQAAVKHGVPAEVLVAIGRAESQLRSNVKHNVVRDEKTGRVIAQAHGVFGFVDKTAKEYGLIGDPSGWTIEQQADAAARLTKNNMNVLRNTLKRDPTPGEIHLAHFLGAGGAVKVLTSHPDTPVQQLVSEDAYKANQFILKDKTAMEVAEWANGKMVVSGAGGIQNFISEESRIQLWNKLEIAERQAYERQLRDDKLLLERREEDELKRLSELVATNQLTPDAVVNARPWIKATHYETYMKMLRSGVTSDDKNAIQDLSRHVDVLDPLEFFEEAGKMLDRGLITNDTFQKYVNNNRELRAKDAPPTAYKAARTMISNTLNREAGQNRALNSAFAQVKAKAEFEFDMWRAQNRDAKDDVVIAKMNEILRAASTTRIPDLRDSMLLSRYFPKDRNKIDITVLKDSLSKLKIDLALRNITPSDAESETRILRDWDEYLEYEQEFKERMKRNTPAQPQPTSRR